MRTPLLLTVEEAARELGIGRTRMFDLIKARSVDSVKVGRARRVPAAALTEYVEKLRAEQREAVA